MAADKQHIQAGGAPPLSVDQIGGALAFARRERKFTLEQVSARLRLPKTYIKALEQSDFDSLPGVAYVPGYLRSYCKLLDIQAAPLIEAWRTSLSEEETQPKYKFPLQALTPRIAGSMAAMLIVVASLTSYALWFVFAQPQNMPEIGASPPEMEMPAGMQGELAALPAANSSELASPAASGPEPAAQADAEPAVAETASEQPADDSQPPDTATELAAGAAGQPVQAKKLLPDQPGLQDDSTALPEVTENRAGAAIARPVNPRVDLVIRAVAPSWVEIVRSDGSVVVSRLLRDGERLMAEIDDGLLLSTGNAGGLMLEFGEAEAMRVGKVGEILRDLPLNRQLLRNKAGGGPAS
jgi:cytoskeleton protein RodZ